MKRKNQPTRLSAKLKSWPSQARSFLLKASFEKKYLAGSIIVLFGTTLLWSILGNSVQIHNADELADSFLFKGSSSLSGATFPGQHTFLIKWPLFWLVRLFSYSSWSFALISTTTVLVTIGALAYLLSRIEKRPMVLGTIFLALSSMLLLIPAEPYAGAILPLNMAMLATRNIEYVLYVVALYGLIKSPGLRSRSFWLYSLLLILVAASDKLFLTLSLGGATLALVVYALAGQWKLVSMSVRWLLASVVAVIGAGGLLTLLAKAKITHIAGSFGSGSYGVVHSFHNLMLGGVYGILGFLTNFGANPGYDANVLKRIPSQAVSRLFGWLGPAEILNLILLGGGLYLTGRLMKLSLDSKARNKLSRTIHAPLALALSWSTAVAMAAFVLSVHYWAVDARYLTIALFSVFISGSVMLKGYRWPTKKLARIGGLLIAGMLIALPGVFHVNTLENKAQAGIVNRNIDISQILKHHKVDVLVGDYWRVLPIKQLNTHLSVMPLVDCTVARADLSSVKQDYDLNKHSFAYLLTLNGSLTNFSRCTLGNTIKAYGRPNASVVIAGSQNNPDELLLFYDQGIRKSSPTITTSVPSTVLPIPLQQLPYTSCPNNTTIMNIVAHQDDDLLFMNPDTQNALAQGQCIRTVYVTAGDAGSDRFYWLDREQASEAAYSVMLKSKEFWVNRIVQLGPKQFVEVSHPRSDYRVSLIFMHLPDGNINGSGFQRYLYESLAGLESGKINSITSVDNQSAYTLGQLTSALTSLMHAYQPVEIHTQANYVSKQYPDHSDHMAVGRLAKKALLAYESEQFENNAQIPIKYYIGYPIHSLLANINGPELQQKVNVFFTYAKFDGAVCSSWSECNKGPYAIYLARQYQSQQ